MTTTKSVMAVTVIVIVFMTTGYLLRVKIERGTQRMIDSLPMLESETDPESLGEVYQVRDVRVTGYTLDPKECGKEKGDKWYGIGASGRKVRIGDCAMNGIPFGYRVMFVKKINGCLMQTVADTGSFDWTTCDVFCGEGKKAKERARKITGNYTAIIFRPKGERGE